MRTDGRTVTSSPIDPPLQSEAPLLFPLMEAASPFGLRPPLNCLPGPGLPSRGDWLPQTDGPGVYPAREQPRFAPLYSPAALGGLWLWAELGVWGDHTFLEWGGGFRGSVMEEAGLRSSPKVPVGCQHPTLWRPHGVRFYTVVSTKDTP